MKHSLRTRLARLERQRTAPHPTDVFKGLGISAVLALSPDPVPDRRDTTTPDELQWMREHRELLDKHCPIREGKSFLDCLNNGRERIAFARRLMAETETV